MKAVDVMGFGGSMAAGVDQAGFDVVAKREPSAFKGFGVASMTYNMPWVEAQVAPWGQWDMPAERDIDLVFGCPPCSGFSQLSSVNTKVYEHTGTTYRGADAEINECMAHLIDYAAKIAPRVVVMESVGPAFKLGRDWMESLWIKLREQSGLDYSLTHVRMNAALVGGDVIRPRYFLVAHLDPFGVGLEFVQPRSFIEVVGDLPAETEEGDSDWGHVNRPGKNAERVTQTIAWLKAQGLDWKQGTRLPTNAHDIGLEPPDFWLKPEHQWRKSKREGYRDDVYSHWYSSDPFSPTRWRADKPFGVIVAASLDRAIHATAPRPLTYREAARFMSLPDTWSMRVLVEQNRADELGKAVPTASAKWISHWARMSIEGTPGEYAGRATGNPKIRVINVTTPKDVQDILDGTSAESQDDEFWPDFSDPDPAIWLVDRKARPAEWWQREDELGIFSGPPKPARTARHAAPPPPAPSGASKTGPVTRDARSIVRVPAADVAALLEELDLSKPEAAKKLGVSIARVNELTDLNGRRPNSLLNADRWNSVQEALRA